MDVTRTSLLADDLRKIATSGMANGGNKEQAQGLFVRGRSKEKDKNSLKKNILRLVDIYYDALDASKTGKKVDIPWELKAETFPHFLEKRNFPSYTSKSVLGLIYDTVDLKTEDKSKEIWQLPCFSGEVPAACMKLWKEHYEVYRGEMQQVMERDDEFKNESADEIILKYKQILYGGKEFEESTRKIEDIYNEAQAIYLINL